MSRGDSITVRVPAKINLGLAVGALRDDGFHDLLTVYQALSLADEVTVRDAERPQMHIHGEGAAEVPADRTNLAWRAAKLVAERIGAPGRESRLLIELRKRIPVAGGMAGGSADAAGVLLGLARLWDTRLETTDLAELAAGLGSDVPFALRGGTAVGTGRGERLVTVHARHRFHWVIALSDGGLSTPAVYHRLDEMRNAGEAPKCWSHHEVLDAVRSGDAAGLAAVLHNDLQPAALSLRPGLRTTLRTGVAAGALAGVVSGSGPTCVFLCVDGPHAQEVALRLSSSGVCRAALVAHGPAPGAAIPSGPTAATGRPPGS